MGLVASVDGHIVAVVCKSRRGVMLHKPFNIIVDDGEKILRKADLMVCRKCSGSEFNIEIAEDGDVYAICCECRQLEEIYTR